MGSCLSKPTSVDGQLFQKTDGHQAAARDLADGVPATIGPATGSREHDTLKVSAEVGRWSPENVATWAASLGLAQTSMQALKGVTGSELLKVTDQRLLQLGVKDAAERHALLAACSSLQQQGASANRPAQLSKLADSAAAQLHGTAQSPTSSLAGPASRAALPAHLDSTGGGTALPKNGTLHSSRESGDDGVQDMQQSPAPLSHEKSGDNSFMVATGTSFSESAELLEGVKDLQVLRITASGRLFRHSRPVPVSLVPYCQAICYLNDLRRGAHYHYDNCHQLLQRCVLVQDYLLALPHKQLQQKTVMLAQLHLLVQDAYDVFSQFSDRGWLLRLLNSVQDQDDFNRLDQMLVNALEAAEVDTSQQPLVELKNPRSYAPQQQQLEAALKNLGGIAKLLRDPLSATIRLQSLLHQLPSGSNIDFILQQEIDHYLSSHLWFSSISSRPGSQENSFNRLGSAGSNGSNGLNRGSSGGSGSGMLRRTSSLGARARPTLSVVEPFMVLRNDTVRTEWRQAFGGRERVTWREFWSKMVQPAAHIWGLDQQLDKFTTDYLQQHLQRDAHGLLTIAELDFAFPPSTSPAMVIQAQLKDHQGSNSSLPAVTLTATARPKVESRANWLRMPQEPVPRLHNFPEFPVGFYPRDEEVSELSLGMADVSTNLVMLTGALGVGRSTLAASLAYDLVVSHHWTDAYWIDLQGINNMVLAGQQLMAGIGLISDVPDTQQLLAWLEGRPRERFGLVLTGVQELLSAPAEEQHGFLDLLENIIHSSQKLQVVVVCDGPLPRITYSARQVEVEPFSAESASEMVKQAQPAVSEDICRFVVEACQGAPVALEVVCGLLRYGHCSAAEFMRLYSDPSLPIERTISDTSSSSYLPFESRMTNERLQRVLVAAAVALPDDLVSGLLVLSLLTAPFSLEMAAPLLVLPATNNERRSILRRLVNLGLLSYNSSLQLYTMHTLVRQAARLLVHNLGLPYVETRRRFAELLVTSARHLVLPLVAKSKMLSARLAWSRISVHVVQLLNWAFQEVREDMLQMYVALAWDLMPLLSSSCGLHTLQGFCQMVVERTQFLDMNMESAQVMTALGALLAEQGALKRADTLLRQALEFFWRELKGPHVAVARCYRELGGLLLRAGKAAEGSKQLQACLEMQEQLFGGLSPELLPVLQLQVELLRRSRKYSEAEGVCQRALGICGAAFGPADVQVAVWKNQLAQVVRQAGRLIDAQSLAQEALAMLQGQLGSEHPRVAAQLMMLGQLAAQQGKQAAAEQTYRKALQVYQTVSGLHHPDTFNCLTSLVSLLRGAGKANHALPLAQRCLAVKKKSLGELHPDTAASMQVVADVMLDLGRYAEVESHCSRAVWVYQQLNQQPSSKPVIVATTMQALGLVLLGRAPEAEQLATGCLEAAKHMTGPAAERNSFVASCYNCLGEALRETGKVADAEAAAREGLAMREKDLGLAHPIVAISLQTLGHILRLRQQLPEALEAAKRCEQLRAAQANGPPMAAALHLQALIYVDMGDLSNALAQGQAALAIRQKVLSSEHPDLAHSLTVVSEVLLMQGKHAEAEPLLSHAVQIFIAQLGSSHPATQRAHMLLKQATNPRSSSISMSMRLISTDLGLRSAAGSEAPSAAVTRQPSAAIPEEVAAGPEQVQITVPLTDSTDLASVRDELVASAAEATTQPALELDGPPTAQFIGAGIPIDVATPTHPVVPIVPGTGMLASSPTGMSPSAMSPAATFGNNISIASRINNMFAQQQTTASGSYAGFLSMGVESPSAGAKSTLASIISGVPEEVEQEEIEQRQAAADEASTEASSRGVPSGTTAAGAEGTPASQLEASSGMAMQSAPAPSDTPDWQLGRQFGPLSSVAAGHAEEASAAARAYGKVLHELTRRTSDTPEGAKGNLLATTPNTALVAAAPADGQADDDSSAAAKSGAGSAAAAADVQAAGAEKLDDLAGLSKDAAVADAAAEAQLAAEEDSKLKKLHGVGGVQMEDLRAFLREHGWQLSRLSMDSSQAPNASKDKAQSVVKDANHKSAASRAGMNLPRGPNFAATGSDAPGGRQSANVSSPGQKEASSTSTPRRPPARHLSFIGSPTLESVQESSMPSTPLPLLGVPDTAMPAEPKGALAPPATVQDVNGTTQQHMQPQQQMQQQQPTYIQSQPRLPEAVQHGVSWQQHGSGGDQQAAAAESQALYYQHVEAAEAEATMSALRAEQNWENAQQTQKHGRGYQGTELGHGEPAHRLQQLQQHHSGGHISESEAAYGMPGMPDVQHMALHGGWMQPAWDAGQGQGRRRRDSWDSSYGPTHPLAEAAAAAAAQCGWHVSGSSDRHRQMQLYQQQTAPVPMAPWHSHGFDYGFVAAGAPGDLSPWQTTSLNSHHHGMLPGSGSSRASVHSGAYYPGGPAAAAAAALQGQRSGSTQYSPISPASALHPDLLHAALSSGRTSGPIAQLQGMISGALPKYPSNISNYSVGSSQSAATHSQHVDAEQQQQQQHLQPVHQQQQGQAADHGSQHPQEQQQYTVAAKARAALSGVRSASEQEQQQLPATPAASARGEGGTSPQHSARSAAVGTAPSSRLRPRTRNVSFKQHTTAAGGGEVGKHHGDVVAEAQSEDLGSPGIDGATADPALKTSLSAGAGVLRSKSPIAQQGGWDEHHQAPHSGPLLGDPADAEGLDGYYGSGGYGHQHQPLPRPFTAGSQGAVGRSAALPLTALPQGPTHYRSRSYTPDSQWADVAQGDAPRAHQLLLQQRVLQVQAARLELQQQQLEIEQMLSDQAQHQQVAQQQHMQQSSQWPAGMAMPPPVSVAQQQRGLAGYYPGPPASALSSYRPLQPTTSSASTASMHSPASPVPLQERRAGVSEQAIDSNAPSGGPYSHFAHIAGGPSPQSSMLTAASTYVPSSPSASSSLSSRPPLSRGTSDNHEGQVAATASALQQQQSALAAARLAQKQQQQQQQVQRPGSPDKGQRGPVPASGPPSGGSRQLQQAQLHRLHKDNDQDYEMRTVYQPPGAAMSVGQHRQQQMMLEQQHLHQQQQQQMMQQMALQVQQQQQQQHVPTTVLGRMGPARMLGRNSPYSSLNMAANPYNWPTAGSPVTAQHVAGQPGYRAGPSPGGPNRAAAGLMMMPGQTQGYGPAAGPYGMAAIQAGAEGPPYGRPMSFVGGRPPFDPGAMQQVRSSYSANATAANSTWDPRFAQQWAMQSQQQYIGAAVVPYDGSGYPGGVPYLEPGSGTEDYEMWAAPPDYKITDSRNGPSSDGRSRSGSASKSFIGPGGGQYWEGRRSNSFGNLQESPEPGHRERQLLRSRSTEDLPAAQEGDAQAQAK